MEQPSLKDVFDVYYHRSGQGEATRSLAGRLLITPTQVDVLADFFGYLDGLDGPLDERKKRRLDSLRNSMYFDVVSREDIRGGKRDDLLREENVPSAPAEDPNGSVDAPILVAPERRPSHFTYHHPAVSQPVVVSVDRGQMMFNGKPVNDIERDRIIGNIRSGVAQIRYKQDERSSSIAKMETLFEDLVKIEPHLESALGALRGAVKAGHVHPEVLRHLTGEIFTDPMVKGVGNKKAYADFAARPREGVHIRMDGNDFGSINKIHSFEHGNQAITAMGGAMREAMDEAVGRGNGKLYRVGGDEFAAHVPTHEHAAKFARALRAKLDAIPPVGGTHALSVSMGFGNSPHESDLASIQAKQAKKAAGYQLGQAKTHAYSAIPGHVGHIPLDVESLPISKPKGEAPEKPTGGPAMAPVTPVAPTALQPGK